jgi:CHAD domain-containing protein
MKAPVNLKASIRKTPPLRGSMTCEAAFQAAASHYLHQLTAQHEGTSAGDAAALHAMRVTMTRLRTTIALFAPMVEGDEQIRLAAELKWLHAHLGIVRDLDVALERLAKIKKGKVKGAIDDRPWRQERAACQRHLTRALGSTRYRRLIRDITAWIENGKWSRRRNKGTIALRARPAGEYCADKVKDWQKKLVKKSTKLRQLGTRKRHRVRLANKRLSYAIEAVAQLAPPSETPAREAILKLLRRAQKSLGQLNDDVRRQALAVAFGADASDEDRLLLSGKQKKRLLRKAAGAYEELAELEPLTMSLSRS